MQLGVLGMLLGIPNGAASGQGNNGQSAGASDIFAQMLNDSGAETGAFANPQAGGQLLGDIAPSALVAQEVSGDGATKLETLQDLLNQEISADDAEGLLEQFDALHAELGDGASDEMLQQLKQALTAIKDSKTPQTVGAVLASMPALHAAPVERGPAVERMLAWMKSAITPKAKDASSQDVAVDDTEENSASPIVQSLQASMFRDSDSAAAETPEKARDYIEIVPLSATVEAAPAWVKQITAQPTARDINAEIPSLKLAEDNTLPQVNLPRMDDGKVTDMAEFRAMMENHVAKHSEVAADDKANLTPVVAANQNVAAAHRPTVATPHAVVNHAPVAEQVHVAISRGKKDGIDQMTIQLEPADLGRVEVSMRTGADGHTQLNFIVDKADTMDALARDARSLERALQEAGVKADAGSMQFNLRQQPNQQQAMGDGHGGQQHARWGNEQGDTAGTPEAAGVTQNYTLTLRDGVDIRA